MNVTKATVKKFCKDAAVLIAVVAIVVGGVVGDWIACVLGALVLLFAAKIR